MTDNRCRACLGENLELLLDLGPQPLAGGFLPPNEQAIQQEQMHPLPIHICLDCGLVQTLHVIPPEILFTNYCFSSSTIESLQAHFTKYASWIKNNYNPAKVVEFGCNDGILLRPLQDIGIDSCGVDISRNITEMARRKGLTVLTGFFDQEIAEKIRNDFGAVDYITGSNCFPHNANPDEILRAALSLLQPNGHFAVEIMYAGDLLENLQWDSMYHEHLCYYCLKTLDVLFKRFGLHIVDAIHLPMHAGSLRVVAAVDPRECSTENVEKIKQYEEEHGLTDPETWRSFARKTKRQINVVKDVFAQISKTKRIWGYGAAGRATMWVNACGMNYLEAMVDASPLRSGRLMPGTHTPIVFPDALRHNPPDYIFVPAWNYIDTIVEKEKWFDGIWSVPLPRLAFF